MKKKSYLLGAMLLFTSIVFAETDNPAGKRFYLSRRPQEDIYLFDYAHILGDVQEYANNYLKNIREKYTIEAVIVSLPALPEVKTIEELAVDILNNWQVGKETGGRGIVLLLADEEKKVKLEVSYELEDMFTDMFCGYVEDLQLGPNFLGGQLGIGMLAVMEELENRAQLRHQGDYTKESIAAMDRNLLSGGAGAGKDLTRFQKEEVKESGQRYPAGKTPEEAWQTLIQSWRDKARDPNLGVYTEITKLTYRDYQNLPDSRYEEDVRTYAEKPYQVIQNDNYAVVFFGNKPGWENSPFLFCRTAEGWKFDLVHQRKYIRMGSSPSWGIERGNYPYIDLLDKCPYWVGQDIPLEEDDIYRVENDQKIAEEIRRLEEDCQNKPDDFNTAMELGKLYTIASMGPKHIALLNKAQQLNPTSPFPYKYLAVAHVDANYQYKTAIEELKEYVQRAPRDAFGHNYLGYLYFCTDDYEKAIEELRKALTLRPDNCYAYCQLAYCYGQLYLQALPLDPRRMINKNLVREMFHKAQNTDRPDPRRIKWLEYWLKEERILE